MTPGEAKYIDRHVTFGPEVPAHELDDKVIQTIQDELKHGELVFIYANKEGAHFPYDHNYPKEKTIFKLI